jgi:lipopolysaccharide assembly protein A
VKHLSWIITLPLTVMVIVFSVNNIADMPVDFWPFGIVVQWPTFLVVLIAIVLGFLFGATVMWFSAGSARREARRQRAEARRLGHELDSLRKATDAARAAQRATAPQLPTQQLATPKLPTPVGN